MVQPPGPKHEKKGVRNVSIPNNNTIYIVPQLQPNWESVTLSHYRTLMSENIVLHTNSTVKLQNKLPKLVVARSLPCITIIAKSDSPVRKLNQSEIFIN